MSKQMYYTVSPHTSAIHKLYGARVEGNRTDCGRMVTTDWHWYLDGRSLRKYRVKGKRCSRCFS